MALKIGLISDTHTNQGAAILELVRPWFTGVDRILHAGDIDSSEVLDALSELAPVDAVRGNMDPFWRHAQLPHKRVLTLDGYRVGLIHGSGGPSGIEARVMAAFEEPLDAIVFGHTHHALVKQVGTVLLVNPGSPTDRRWAPSRTLGILDVGTSIEARIVELA